MNLNTNSNELIIIGAGGHSRPVIDIAKQLGYDIIGIVDLNYTGENEQILGVKVIGNETVLETISIGTSVFVAIGDNIEREKWFNKLYKANYNLPSLIHPSAILSPHLNIGKGVLVNAGTIVNSESVIENGCIINTGVIIDHESKIGAFTHLAPGVSLAGRTEIGKLSFIGIGSSVIDKIKIGERVVVGANSTIIKNISADSKVVGVSKII